MYYSYKVLFGFGRCLCARTNALPFFVRGELLLQGTYFIALMPFVDSDLRFVSVDVGVYGRQSDVGTLRVSRFGKCLEEGRLGLPSR